MEGPSIVIAKEEFSRFVNRKIDHVDGVAKGTAGFPFELLKNRKLLGVRSMGKQFLMEFAGFSVRVHFLMFGSYRINDPRPNRIPKMTLTFGDDKIYFYACSIRLIKEPLDEIYDFTIDVMSPTFDTASALRKVRAKPKRMVCDVLMDQEIFAGVGNIIKNEVLFNLRIHPERKVGEIAPAQQRALVKEAVSYSFQFYEWKKKNVLKRHWRVMRKKICPRCESKITRKLTGIGQRRSFFCPHCQPRKVTGKSKLTPVSRSVYKQLDH